ncbi:oxidase [Pelagivirga sediminicola]|uniref:Oxidase n=1 Tax=Pelagivirga sediminicola TaxID=2170575 RepID=A0A2T7G3B0_9RHOB|nr:cytochrome C oxidase subunit IV family protein [Pelagivirga sediminicola]PVA08902.1 oxidase [Pelagivirga sediminicola]
MTEKTHPGRLWRKAALVWVALSLALAATVVGAYLDIGAWKLPLAMAIAAFKAALVAAIFMELTGAGAGTRIAALVGLLWLALMLSLTFADETTRAQSSDGFTQGAE